MSRYHYQFQIVVAGEIAVGKTSLVREFTGYPSTPQLTSVGQHVQDQVVVKDQPTTAIESFEKRVQVNDQMFKLVITDIGGNERFSTATSRSTSHYTNAAGVMLVFDLTNRRSFYETIKWMDDVRRASTVNLPVFMLVGNKKDKLNAVSNVQLPHDLHQTQMSHIHLLGTGVTGVSHRQTQFGGPFNQTQLGGFNQTQFGGPFNQTQLGGLYIPRFQMSRGQTQTHIQTQTHTQTKSVGKIKTQEGESMADAYKMDYIETSATDGTNVTDAFALLSGKIYEAMVHVDGKIRVSQGWNGVLSYDDVQRQRRQQQK